MTWEIILPTSLFISTKGLLVVESNKAIKIETWRDVTSNMKDLLKVWFKKAYKTLVTIAKAFAFSGIGYRFYP